MMADSLKDCRADVGLMLLVPTGAVSSLGSTDNVPQILLFRNAN